MKRVIAGMLLSWVCMHAAAQDPAANIMDLYRQYSDVGVLSGKFKAWRVSETSMQVSSAKGDARYRVPASIAFTFPQHFIEQSAAVEIMEAVANDLGRVCRSTGGEIRFEPRSGIDQAKAERDIKRLQQKKLYGRFECLSDVAPFEMEVQPGKVVTESQLPPAVSWTIVLATAMPDQVIRIRDQRRFQDRDVDAFRRALKPGMAIAVRAADVPARLQSPEVRKLEEYLRGRAYFVCGLAVDVKEALVQVQVNGGLFYVPPSSVGPVKEEVPLGGTLPPESLTGWCIKSY